MVTCPAHNIKSHLMVNVLHFDEKVTSSEVINSSKLKLVLIFLIYYILFVGLFVTRASFTVFQFNC